MGQTKRPLNKCRQCGHTWYPKGQNISLKCPNCGSNEVSMVGPGIIGGIVMLVIVVMTFGKGHSSSAATEQTASAPIATSSSQNDASAAERNTQQATVRITPAPSAPIAKQNPAIQPQTPSPSDQPPEANQEANATLSTPTQICQQSSNDFMRNNCMWQECSKPQNHERPECANNIRDKTSSRSGK